MSKIARSSGSLILGDDHRPDRAGSSGSGRIHSCAHHVGTQSTVLLESGLEIDGRLL